MKKFIGIIIFLTLFIFSSCGTDLYVTNPTYVPYYEYIVVVDYPQPRRFIPKHGFYNHPRFRTHIKYHEYRFNKN